MTNIEIRTKPFFELLKEREQSMWQVFAQMIDGEEKVLLFLDEEGKELMHYILPATAEELRKEQELFATHFRKKLEGLIR